MSRRAGAATAGPSRLHIQDSSGRIKEHSTPTDKCPICKSDRFLNPKLRLLVSTTCYHQMCESCIDRIFTLGPEPCPTCGVLLRKISFAAQTFGDLKIEKEVSVRKRIARWSVFSFTSTHHTARKLRAAAAVSTKSNLISSHLNNTTIILKRLRISVSPENSRPSRTGLMPCNHKQRSISSTR